MTPLRIFCSRGTPHRSLSQPTLSLSARSRLKFADSWRVDFWRVDFWQAVDLSDPAGRKEAAELLASALSAGALARCLSSTLHPAP